jgi:6,7-dimethyl-8-ribityllumazine synthase
VVAVPPGFTLPLTVAVLDPTDDVDPVVALGGTVAGGGGEPAIIAATSERIVGSVA